MNWFIKAIRALSPNCQEATRLQSNALDRPLPRWQRIGLWIHLKLCVWCSRYARQIAWLRVVAQRCEPGAASKPNLSPEARERIKHTLEAGKKSPAEARLNQDNCERNH